MTNNILLPNANSGNSRSLMPHSQATPAKSPVRSAQEEIARRAYYIYLNHGSPQGCDMQHWLEAEAQVTKARKTGQGSVLM